MQRWHDLIRECSAWGLSLAAYGIMALLILRSGGSAGEAGAARTRFVAVAPPAAQEREAPSPPTAEPAPPPALDLTPLATKETPATSDAWDSGAAGAGPHQVPARPASSLEVSEDAIRALPLELEVGEPDRFLTAAQALGLRFLVYPAGPDPAWLVELSGPRLAAARRLTAMAPGSLSRRAHDLTPHPFFRRLRDDALRRLGLPAAGTRIVAAVPGGTDRMFLAAERRFLAERGLSPEKAGTLHGRLRPAGTGWELAILSASGLE